MGWVAPALAEVATTAEAVGGQVIKAGVETLGSLPVVKGVENIQNMMSDTPEIAPDMAKVDKVMGTENAPFKPQAVTPSDATPEQEESRWEKLGYNVTKSALGQKGESGGSRLSQLKAQPVAPVSGQANSPRRSMPSVQPAEEIQLRSFADYLNDQKMR